MTSILSSSIEPSKMTPAIYWPTSSSLHGNTMARGANGHLANFAQLAKCKGTSSASDLMKKLLYLLLMTRCMVNRVVITVREPMTSGMIDLLIFLTMLATVFTISDASVIVIDTSVPSSNGFHSSERQNLHPPTDLLYVS